MRKRHIVVLSEEERAWLRTMIGRGAAPASALTHARILLKASQGEAGPGWTGAAIGAALEVNPATVARVRRKYVAAGLDAAVHRRPVDLPLVMLTGLAEHREQHDGAVGPASIRYPGRCLVKPDAKFPYRPLQVI